MIRLISTDNKTVALERSPTPELKRASIIRYKKKLYVYRGTHTTGGEMWYHEEEPAVLE